jgi:hypothetical protein
MVARHQRCKRSASQRRNIGHGDDLTSVAVRPNIFSFRAVNRRSRTHPRSID